MKSSKKIIHLEDYRKSEQSSSQHSTNIEEELSYLENLDCIKRVNLKSDLQKILINFQYINQLLADDMSHLAEILQDDSESISTLELKNIKELSLKRFSAFQELVGCKLHSNNSKGV